MSSACMRRSSVSARWRSVRSAIAPTARTAMPSSSRIRKPRSRMSAWLPSPLRKR
jgi:hypothetical protein